MIKGADCIFGQKSCVRPVKAAMRLRSGKYDTGLLERFDYVGAIKELEG